VAIINEILEFAANADSGNMLDQSAYTAAADRLTGHVPGLASQALENAVLRNLSRFCKGVAAFIATNYPAGVVNDGDEAKIVAGMAAAIAAVAPAPAQATTTAQGVVELATNAEAVTGTDTERAVTPAGVKAAIAAGGSAVDELYIDAGAMTPAITGGASLAVVEDATNHLTRNVMSFQGSTANTSAEINFQLPSNWDHGPLKFKPVWAPAAGASVGDNVRFSLAGLAVSDGEALDQALGSAVTVDDAVIAAGDVHIGPASAAMTLANTPAAGDYLRLVLTRIYNYGSPAMSVAAQLLGVKIQYGITGNVSAW
jgi:hypothetical protein